MRVDLDRGTGGVPDEERYIWDRDEHHLLLLSSTTKTHIVWPITAADRGRIPVFVALPFCWKLGVDGLRSRFRVELAAEKPPGICALRFTPQTPLGRQSFSKALVILDLSTYLPARYVMISPDGNSTRDYRVTEIRCDRPVPDELWRIPDDQGWQVVRHGADRVLDRWLVRLIKIDLVP